MARQEWLARRGWWRLIGVALVAAVWLAGADPAHRAGPRPVSAQATNQWNLAKSWQDTVVEPDSMCFSTTNNISMSAALFLTHVNARCGDGLLLAKHLWTDLPKAMVPTETLQIRTVADARGSGDYMWDVTTHMFIKGGATISRAYTSDINLLSRNTVDWVVPSAGPTAGELEIVVRAENGKGKVETHYLFVLPGAPAAGTAAAGAAPPAAAPAATETNPGPASPGTAPAQPVAAPDLVAMLFGPESAPAGMPVTYTVMVWNAGLGAAGNVKVTLPLSFAFAIDGGTRLIAARGGHFWCEMPADYAVVVTCTAPTLAAGEGAVIEVTIKAPDNANTITAEAGVSSAQTDADPTNNLSPRVETRITLPVG